MKLPHANLQVNEKNFFQTSSSMHFAFIFLEYITITFPRLQYLSGNGVRRTPPRKIPPRQIPPR